MPKDAFEQAIDAAIDGTSNEIFSQAFGQEDSVLDETGDRTVEAMGEGLEGQIEPEDLEDGSGDGDEPEPEPDEPEPEESDKPDEDEDAQAKPADKPEARVPSARLREQTERAKALETERDALKAQLADTEGKSRSEIAELKAQLNGVTALVQKLQPQQTEVKKPGTEDVPDIFEDPEAYLDHINKGFDARINPVLQRLDNQRVENSMAIAHAVHKDVFEKAYAALTALDPKNQDNAQIVGRIWNSPNPGQAVIDWHRRTETLRVVGDDPVKYRDNVAKEIRDSLMKDPDFRKQIIADLQAEAAGNGTPNTITRLPKSLNGARGSTRETIDPSMLDDSQDGIFESAFAQRR